MRKHWRRARNSISDAAETLKQRRRRMMRRLTGGGVALIVAGVLVMSGMPPHQAHTAGQAAGKVYDAVTGDEDGEKKESDK